MTLSQGSGGHVSCFLAQPMSFLLPPPAYQITHRLNATTANTASVEVLAPSARQYTATGLKPESVYLFRITAQTRKGWGEAAEALVVTTEKRGDCPLGLGRPEGQLTALPPTHPGVPTLSPWTAGLSWRGSPCPGLGWKVGSRA